MLINFSRIGTPNFEMPMSIDEIEIEEKLKELEEKYNAKLCKPELF